MTGRAFSRNRSPGGSLYLAVSFLPKRILSPKVRIMMWDKQQSRRRANGPRRLKKWSMAVESLEERALLVLQR